MEEAVGSCADGFVAVYAPRAEYADRRLLGGHHARLYTGCVCAEKDVGRLLHALFLLDKEGILHVASGMFRRKVEHAEYVLVIFDLGSVSYDKTDARENLDDLFPNE